MRIEGRLDIRIEMNGEHVGAVKIHSSRPLLASRVFEGGSVQRALQIMPSLFNICGTAHSCAAVRACEQAMNAQPEAAVEQVRDRLVYMETISEHLWRILLDWPVLLSEDSEKKAMAATASIKADFRQQITDGDNPFLQPGNNRPLSTADPEKVVSQLGSILEHRVFSMPINQWLEIRRLDELDDWAKNKATVAARLIHRVIKSNWAGLGKNSVQALPSLERDRLEELMEEENFVRQPDYFGDCRETSALTRTESPLLKQLAQLNGNGLLVRLVAHMTETAQLANQLISGAEQGCKTDSYSKQGSGIGQLEAARGRLIHRVQLNGDRIDRYQILAPTEWNFHPQGVAAQSLLSLRGEIEEVEQQSRFLINAIDPCVGYELSIG